MNIGGKKRVTRASEEGKGRVDKTRDYPQKTYASGVEEEKRIEEWE